MEKVKNNPLFWIWAFLGFLGMLLIWNLPWRFQVNDDEIMMWLVSGAYTGQPESYAVFIHPILSWCFAKLYMIAPAVKWYPACWFLVMYLSYLGYLKLIRSKVQENTSAHLWSMFAFCFLVHFLFFLQFSIVAAFAISSGLANRFGGNSSGKSTFFGFYSTDFLLILGFLIRPEVLLLFLAAYLVLSVLIVRNFSLLKRLVFPVLVVVAGYSLSQSWIVRSDLAEFQRFNHLRSQVFDHPVLQLNKEEFRESDPELYHFANGLMDFGSESELPAKLEGWKKELDGKRLGELSLGYVSQSFTTYILHERFFIGLMILFVLFALGSDWKKGLSILTVLITIMLFLFSFFLLKIQIYALIFLAYFSFCLFHFSSTKLSKRATIAIISILAIALGNHFFSYTQSSENLTVDKNLKAQVTSLHEAGLEEIYLVGSGNLYNDQLFVNRLEFKVLGWPTLLAKYGDKSKAGRRAYLVDSATYSSNSSYFDTEVLLPSISDQILLISKE